MIIASRCFLILSSVLCAASAYTPAQSQPPVDAHAHLALRCAGVAPDFDTRSYFRSGVARVEAIHETRVAMDGIAEERLRGATLYVRVGRDTEHLRHLVDCHVPRARARVVPVEDPIAIAGKRGGHVRVSRHGDDHAIVVTVDHSDADDVVRSAEALPRAAPRGVD